jgi:hypothetical protein
VLGALAVVVVAGLVLLLPRTQPVRITRLNYDRIQTSMTRADIEAILGPPGDYSNGPALGESAWLGEARIRFLRRGAYEVAWICDSACITVEYQDRNGKEGVVGFSYTSLERADEGPVANLFWRMKRQWHRCFPGQAVPRPITPSPLLPRELSSPTEK